MFVHRLANRLLDCERLDEFLEAAERYPNSCDEVWLSSLYGFPKLEAHEKAAESYAGYAKRFREKGIKVSLQISNTLGHGASGLSNDNSGLFYDGSDVFLTKEDGEKSNCIICAASPEFLTYLKAELKLYLEAVKPEGVWIDDDLRLSRDHNCYCERCMKLFNERNGLNITREELVRDMHKDKALRSRWVEFNEWRVGNVARVIGGAIAKYSPDSYPALQNGEAGCIKGNWQKAIFDAYFETTGKAGAYRPGGGAYDDRIQGEIWKKHFEMSMQIRRLPESVKEICPEIENLPDVVYGKSIAGQTFEAAYYFAATGATSMSYATMMRVYEPMSWLTLQMKAMSKNYEYFKKISDINRVTLPGGAEIAMPDTPYKVLDSEKPFDWNRSIGIYGAGFCGLEFMHCAIPVSFGKNGKGAYLLFGTYAEAMTETELLKLLSENVFCDGRAAEIIWERGLGERLGVKVEKKNVRSYAEYYTNHQICGDVESKLWSMNFFGAEHYVITDGDFETVTEYRGVRDESDYGGVSGAVCKTSLGGRWYICGYSPLHRNGILSFDKRNQYLRAMEYIGVSADAVLLDRLPAHVFPRIDKNGKTLAVSVVNVTVGESDELHLLLKAPASDKFTFCTIDGEFVSVKAEKTEKGTVVTLPSIKAYGIGTVFVK